MTSAIDRSKCRVDAEQEGRRLWIRSPVQDIGRFRIQSRIVGDGKEILGGYVQAPARSHRKSKLDFLLLPLSLKVVRGMVLLVPSPCQAPKTATLWLKGRLS